LFLGNLFRRRDGALCTGLGWFGNISLDLGHGRSGLSDVRTGRQVQLHRR
jgi:hypothetical protein